MNKKLNQSTCIPCNKTTPALSSKEAQSLLSQLSKQWYINKSNHLKTSQSFSNFKQALLYTNQVAEIAEKEQHHPLIQLQWGKVDITIWTHSIQNLSKNDFILAAKIDQLK